MYEIFEALMREFNVKATNISKATGIAPSTFSDWKAGRYTPKGDKLAKIADYFGISVQAFYADISELPNFLKVRERKPIYDLAAGQGRVNGDFAEEYKTEDTDSEEYTWCRIYGDSMYPELHDGDMVKVHLQTETIPQDLTVVKINGDEATVKYVEITDKGVWLRAINKDVYQDRFFTVSEVMTLPVQIIGKVTMFQRSYR